MLAGWLCAGAAAAAPDPDWRSEHHLASGVRFGVIPPVFAVAEMLARPAPHLALGIFGMAVDRRSSGGGEVMVETARPGASTPYVQLAYLYYSDDGQRPERGHILYATAGYTWKSAHGEAQLGGGLLFFLSYEIAPCPAGSFICIGDVLPRALPTLDVAFRFAAF
ncbi:MAG TPA: hypothetical protein VFL36_17095 [Myxococcales bacterium]|nr:hypothetical protein [Myxococcales bacterium]